jgi:hypothetical protein
MSCDCYKIGGPFIAEDPNCPVHGREAQAEEKRHAAELEDLHSQIAELRQRVEQLERTTKPEQADTGEKTP